MVSPATGDVRRSSKNCMNSSWLPKCKAPAGGTPGPLLEGTVGGRGTSGRCFGKVLSGSVAAVDQPPAGSPGGRDQPARVAAAITVGDGGVEARSTPAV